MYSVSVLGRLFDISLGQRRSVRFGLSLAVTAVSASVTLFGCLAIGRVGGGPRSCSGSGRFVFSVRLAEYGWCGLALFLSRLMVMVTVTVMDV